MSPRRTRSSLHVALTAALIAALVLLQTLGLMHRIVHAGTAAAAVHANAGVAPAAWAETLFAGHDKGSACALYDQLLQPHAAVDTACAAKPAFAPPRPADQHRAWQLALQAHGFLARGPPALA